MSVRTEVEVALERAQAAEKRAQELTAELDALNRKSRHDLEAVQTDLLATTRQVVLLEAALEAADARIESLRSCLVQIATSPSTHSAEARGMRQVAAAALRQDR